MRLMQIRPLYLMGPRISFSDFFSYFHGSTQRKFLKFNSQNLILGLPYIGEMQNSGKNLYALIFLC